MLLLGSDMFLQAVVALCADVGFSTVRDNESSRCHTVTVFVCEHRNKAV